MPKHRFLPKKLCRIDLLCCAVACGAVVGLLPCVARADEPTDTDFFERKIRPVLVERCLRCHSEEAERSQKLKGGLRLDTRSGARTGGESGPAVVPGKPEDSLLISALRYESFEMPPEGQLPPEVIADFEKWIRNGAADPRESPTEAAEEMRTVNWSEARQFWSFVAPRRHALPATKSSGWIQQPIDAFVLAQLEQTGLAPNPPADRRSLVRRVSLDLTGLLPEPAVVESFVHDDSPLAYQQLVDRLLASPQFGERWARLWLDIARYGEDQAHIVGDDRSLCYPNAYLYRDWVVRSWNEDLPYDEFLKRQLAADLMHPEDASAHVALGFLGLGPKYYRRNAPEVMADEWEDRVDTVSRGLLGLTVACARCHDHKYDPIPTEDYYALAGVFASTEMYNRPLEEKAELDKKGQAKDPAHSMHIVRDIEPKDLAVQIRGDFKNTGPVVPRRFLQVLGGESSHLFDHGSGRLDLAEAIIARDNPLTARVLVNRVWAQCFGQALVATPSNFGTLGQRPTHPELLDDLAVRFMEAGWSLKALLREIVLSATYQQSSELTPASLAIDPANERLWRMNRRRLSVESWRDSLLLIAGRLDLRLGGSSINPQDPDQRRRTLYSEVSRLKLDPLLAMFDFPDPNAHSERRTETTTPLQKLFVLNSPFMIEQAKSLGEQVSNVSADNTQCVLAAYREVFARAPDDDELRWGLEFLSELGDDHPDRWTQFCHVLLASNELLVID